MKSIMGILGLTLMFFSCTPKSKSHKNYSLVSTITTKKEQYKIGEAIELTLEVKNNSKAYTFLPWGTVLENSLKQDCLKITHNNEVLKYFGPMLKRIPRRKDYITLKKNQTISGTVDVLKGYKLEKKGTYTIQSKERNIPASNILTIEIK